LDNNLRLLKRFIDDPPVFEDGKSGADLLRRKVVRKEDSDTDGSMSSDSDGLESSDKTGKSKKKRKRRTLDDTELQTRREKRRLADLEKRAMIKSSVRIIDSDDDEDADAKFFERERELRMKMARMAEDGTLPDQGTRKRTQKKKKSPQRREETPISIVEMDDADATEPASQASQSSANFGDLENYKNRSEDEDDLMPVKKRRIRRAVSIGSDGE
jgi:replication fork protection complex subunit Tof1/Swi1